MNIYSNFDEIKKIPHPVLTIGTFDGVHLGHQKIIQKVNQIAEAEGGESVMFTFYPHPRMVLFPKNHELKLIQTQEEKLDKLARLGLQNVIVYPFTKEFSQLEPEEFVKNYLVDKLKIGTIVIGYDHHFGKNRRGDIHLLREMGEQYGFKIVEISAEDIDDVNISSTKTRLALQEGDVFLANKYLGEPYELNGEVIHGEKLGRKLGFPTANLDLKSDIKLVPSDGVYASKVVLENGETHFGLMSIGTRPTVNDYGILSVEVYILDFDGNLYGQLMKVKMLKRIRGDKKFDNLDTLITRMKKDEKVIRHWMDIYHW